MSPKWSNSNVPQCQTGEGNDCYPLKKIVKFLHRQTKPTSTRKERFSQTSQKNPQVVRRSFKRSACNRLSLRFLRLKTGLKDLQGPPRTTLPTPLYRHYFRMSRWHTHKICHIHQERASCSVLEETARSDRGSEVAKKSWEEELVLTRTVVLN